MKGMHPLLQRQRRRFFGSSAVPGAEEAFTKAVNQAYYDFDDDRGMLERSLELSSQELMQANSDLIALIHAFPDIFLRLSPEGRIIKYQRNEYSDHYPWPQNLIGSDFCEVVGERYAARFKEALRRVHELREKTSLEFIISSQGFPYHFEARLVPMEDEQIFVVIRDITERKQAEEQLIYYTMFDPLTNLYNRAFFEHEMQRLEEMSRNPLGFIICDVDNLKIVNDTYGHNKGDLLLMEVASILHKALRKEDIIARIGGDEFAIILPDCGIKAVESTCLRIREAITQYNNTDPDIPLSISVGYSVRTLSRESMEDIFKQADDNMYKEKFIHHRRMSGDMARSVFEVLSNRRFIVEGKTESAEAHDASALIRFEGLEDSSCHSSDILMRYNQDNNYGNIILPALPPGKSIEEYRDQFKALLVLINMILDAWPDNRNADGNNDRAQILRGMRSGRLE